MTLRRAASYLLGVLVATSLTLGVAEAKTVKASKKTDPLEKAVADRTALQHALEKWKVVELEPDALYYLDQSVVVPDFNGSLLGNGATIETVPGHEFKVVLVGLVLEGNRERYPARGVLTFPYSPGYEGTIVVTDLVIKVTEPAEIYPSWQIWGWEDVDDNTMNGIDVLNSELDYSGPYYSTDPVSLNARFANVTIQGVEDPRFTQYFPQRYADNWGLDFVSRRLSVATGIRVWGPVEGRLDMTNVDVSNAALGLSLANGEPRPDSEDLEVVIGGSRSQACHFENIHGYYGALDFYSMRKLVLSHNEIGGALYLSSSSGTVAQNRIQHGRGRLGAIYLNRSTNMTISGNTIRDFTLEQSWRAAIYLWASDGNEISDNEIEGLSSGAAGIRLRGGSSYNEILDNEITDAVTPAAIRLDGGTRFNRVVDNEVKGFSGQAAIHVQGSDCVIADNEIEDGTAEAALRIDGSNNIVTELEVEDFLASVASLWFAPGSWGNTAAIEDELDYLNEGAPNDPDLDPSLAPNQVFADD